MGDAAGLRSLLHRLTTFKVLVWDGTSADMILTNPEMAVVDREEAPMDEAHVVSSKRKDGRHALVIDIDHPCYLVRSTTPGHYHLYVDVPDGIDWPDYVQLLNTLATAGVIEPGYHSASVARGHSDVRLPWIKKEEK